MTTRASGPALSDAVGILIFDGVEVMDFAGPFEVFSVARRDPARRGETSSPVPPVLLARGMEPVTTTGGMQVLPGADLAEPPPLRALIVPGGIGVRKLLEDQALHARIRDIHSRVELIISVCTGALLLGRMGLLEGREATTHGRYLDVLAAQVPGCRVVGDRRVVDQGGILTSGGIAAGIDAALYLLARWEGEEVAAEAADYMEYRPAADRPAAVTAGRR